MKHRKSLRHNSHGLGARLKYAATHKPAKSIGITLLASMATGIAIGYYFTRK